jgi:alkylation response protein AidB-like acyl-CoA dehydrogenase
MSDYQFPYKDAQFLIHELLDFDQMCADAGMQEVNSELADAVMEEAGRFGSEVLAPLNKSGDENGSTLEKDGVHEPAGFAEAYRQYVDNGWASLTADEEFGGQAMPRLLAAAVVEVWDTSNVAFSLCPLLTTGAVESVLKHGTDELKTGRLCRGTGSHSSAKHPGLENNVIMGQYIIHSSRPYGNN